MDSLSPISTHGHVVQRHTEPDQWRWLSCSAAPLLNAYRVNTDVRNVIALSRTPDMRIVLRREGVSEGLQWLDWKKKNGILILSTWTGRPNKAYLWETLHSVCICGFRVEKTFRNMPPTSEHNCFSVSLRMFVFHSILWQVTGMNEYIRYFPSSS